MTTLYCAVVACQNEAFTVYRGYALCQRCSEVTDEIPDMVPAALLERIISDVISGDGTTEENLAKRGYTHPRSPRETELDP